MGKAAYVHCAAESSAKGSRSCHIFPRATKSRWEISLGVLNIIYKWQIAAMSKGRSAPRIRGYPSSSSSLHLHIECAKRGAGEQRAHEAAAPHGWAINPKKQRSECTKRERERAPPFSRTTAAANAPSTTLPFRRCVCGGILPRFYRISLRIYTSIRAACTPAVA
jgi:hypothetical protein